MIRIRNQRESLVATSVPLGLALGSVAVAGAIFAAVEESIRGSANSRDVIIGASITALIAIVVATQSAIETLVIDAERGEISIRRRCALGRGVAQMTRSVRHISAVRVLEQRDHSSRPYWQLGIYFTAGDPSWFPERGGRLDELERLRARVAAALDTSASAGQATPAT